MLCRASLPCRRGKHRIALESLSSTGPQGLRASGPQGLRASGPQGLRTPAITSQQQSTAAATTSTKAATLLASRGYLSSLLPALCLWQPSTTSLATLPECSRKDFTQGQIRASASPTVPSASGASGSSAGKFSPTFHDSADIHQYDSIFKKQQPRLSSI